MVGGWVTFLIVQGDVQCLLLFGAFFCSESTLLMVCIEFVLISSSGNGTHKWWQIILFNVK